MHTPNPITRGIWLALLLTASGALVAAERTDAKKAEDAAKAQPTTALKTVTVTAQHREETLQETPTTVSAVNGTNITADGVRAIGDITTFVPNAAAKNPDGDGRPRWYIRGLGTGDTGAATVFPVGIYADDVSTRPSPVAARSTTWSASRSCAARRAPCTARTPPRAP